MSIVKKLGSFPNSQIKPTSAVRQSAVMQFNIVDGDPNASDQYFQPADIVKTIVTNGGDFPFQYAYDLMNISVGPIVQPGGAVTVDDAEATMYFQGVGGDTTANVDERIG